MANIEFENELIEAFDKHDKLMIDCATGSLPFWDFVKQYNNFYLHWALDGHESDDEERKLLQKHENRILPHREITEKVLNGVCADEDAKREIYIKANRFGSDVAVEKVREIVKKYFGH